MPFNKGKELKYTAMGKNITEFRRLCTEEGWLIQDAVRQSDEIAPIPTLCPICTGNGCIECNDKGVL